MAWGDFTTWADFTWGDPDSIRYFLVNPSRETGRFTRDPFDELTRFRVGSTVVKRDGAWLTVRNKRDDWLRGCTYVFRGGYENEVTASQKAELEAAGYTVQTRTATVDESSPDPTPAVAWGAYGTWSAWSEW